jgi:chitinase
MMHPLILLISEKFLAPVLLTLAVAVMGSPLAQPSRQVKRFISLDAWTSNTSTPSIPDSNASVIAASSTPVFLNGAYVPDWQACDEDCAQAPVSHVNYAFASIREDGSLIVDKDRGLDIWRDRKVNHPAFKLLLAVGGGHEAAAAGFIAVGSDPQKRRSFAQSALDLVEQYRLDGIDIDWEYPNSATMAVQYLDIISALRDILGENRVVSTALPADPSILQYIPFAQLADKIDYLNLMAYDFVGAGPVTAAFTGHQAELFSVGAAGASGLATVDYITSRAFPSRKILLGIPLYGRSFSGASWLGENGQSRGSEVGYAVSELPKSGMQEWYDSDAVAVFAVGQGEFISYDNKISVARKAEFAREKALGGLVYWQLLQDRHGGESLVRAGAQALNESCREEARNGTGR